MSRGQRIGTGWAALVALACGVPEASRALSETAPGAIERLRVQVLAARPHDPQAFTQGLLWHQGVLYESIGHYGRSEVRRLDPATGAVLAREPLSDDLFAEGLVLVGERLIQLTWKAGIARVLDRRSLREIDRLGYRGEGWGLAYDGRRLVMSDGSAALTFRDPDEFSAQGTLDVTLEGQPLRHLNELEFAAGALYANVWMQERLVRIDLDSGRVTAVIDARGLLTPTERQRVDVLNGIAYDDKSNTFWLTGKYWPKLFQVTFLPDKP